jgi:hypothetical protein
LLANLEPVGGEGRMVQLAVRVRVRVWVLNPSYPYNQEQA